MRRFKYVIIIIFVATTVLLFKNVGANKKVEEVGGNIVILASNETYSYINESAQAFMKSNEKSNIEVRVANRSEYNAKLIEGVRSDVVPNIIQLSSKDLQKLIAEEELDKYILEEKKIIEVYSNNFTEGRVEEVRINEKLVGVPLTSRPLVLYLREDMLAQYGYTHEDINTWDDMRRVGEDIYEKSQGRVRILNATGEDYEDLISLLVMQAMEESQYRNNIKEIVSQRLDELKNIMNTNVNGEFLARISSINSMRELSLLNVECTWTANNAPAKYSGSNRFYVAEGENLIVLNQSEENSELIRRFIGFLATNTKENMKYVKEGEFFSSFLSTYNDKLIEEEVKNFKGKSPLVVMNNIVEKAPIIENYQLYIEIKREILND